jgi:hypothetical protein
MVKARGLLADRDRPDDSSSSIDLPVRFGLILVSFGSPTIHPATPSVWVRVLPTKDRVSNKDPGPDLESYNEGIRLGRARVWRPLHVRT